MRRLQSDRGERGSVSLELAILAPSLLLLLGVLVLAGRVETSTSAVEQAARAAARDASLTRTADAARAAAATSAQRELAASRCASTQITVDTTGFAAPLGTDASVRVQVVCAVSLADLGIPGLPGSRAIAGQATSPLDRYRSR